MFLAARGRGGSGIVVLVVVAGPGGIGMAATPLVTCGLRGGSGSRIFLARIR
jgi:hypothetical protein